MIEAAVPELADGGYWYVVQAIVEDGVTSPGEIPGEGWCAWYFGPYALVRCPEPVVGLVAAVNLTPSVNGRPYGRVGGR